MCRQFLGPLIRLRLTMDRSSLENRRRISKSGPVNKDFFLDPAMVCFSLGSLKVGQSRKQITYWCPQFS